MAAFNYRHRDIESLLEEYLGFFSVVGLMGPRQSGKSSLLREKLSDYRYVSFDDVTVRQRFYEDPKAFMRIYGDRVVFDEAQKVPEIFEAIKLAVDEDRHTPGKFVISGSSQFWMMKNIVESLAGRIGLLSLLPFSWNETPEDLRQASIYCGSYPELVNKAYRMKEAWYASYMDTYLTRDVRDFAQVKNIHAFSQLISLLAAQVGNQLNYSSLSKELGVDVNTVKHWVSVLEASFVVFLLPPYFPNLSKRWVKSPKIYFYDTGLVSFLTGIETEAQYEKGPIAGGLFENYLVMEVLKKEKNLNTNAQLFYLRAGDGSEVDLVIDRKSHQEWIEIKKGETFSERMLGSIRKFIAAEDKGILLYSGKTEPHESPFEVLNYQDYLNRPCKA